MHTAKIKLGIYRDPEAYLQALKLRRLSLDGCGPRRQRVTVTRAARRLLYTPQFLCREYLCDIELVFTSGAELGFATNTSYADILARARTEGLSKTPLDVSLAFWLQVENIDSEYALASQLLLTRDNRYPDLRTTFKLSSGDGLRRGPAVETIVLDPRHIKPQTKFIFAKR